MPKAVFDLCVFDEVAFDESGGVPTAITQAASNIGETTARINGKISDDGGESCEARFRWRKPEETEEQTSHNSSTSLYAGGITRHGQRLTITDRTVTNLFFCLSKFGSPTGDVTFTIRKVSDDSVLASKVWGDASALAATPTHTWYEATFDTPTAINEEVRILAEFSGGNSSNGVYCRYQAADVKASEIRTRYDAAIPSYVDTSTQDGAYKYAYQHAWTESEWQNTLVTDSPFYEDLTGLDEGVEYEFQTQAKNSAGESAWSESAYFETALVITPSFIQAIASVVAPTVKQGNIIYVPTPIDAISKAVSPSVLYGAITPSPVSAIASGVNPIVVLTSISITPTSIEAIGQVVAPIVSTGGIIYVTPTPLDAIGGRVNPTVILGSISLTPSTLSAIAQVALGNVKQGNIIFSPAFIKALGKAVSPTVIQGSITLEPESIKAIARGENPEVILGSMTITAESVKALAGVIAPTVLETWVGRKLRIKIVTSQYRNLDIITSQKRNIDIVTAQKRKIKVLTSGS